LSVIRLVILTNIELTLIMYDSQGYITYINNKCIFELYHTKNLRLAHVLREETALCARFAYRTCDNYECE